MRLPLKIIFLFNIGVMLKTLCKGCSVRAVMLMVLFCCILQPGMAFCGESFSGFVKKIIDGDSIIVSAKNKTIEVRLYGIDCPEYDQRFAKQARKFVKSKINKKKIIVHPLYHDSYGRLVAVISHGNAVLNSEIVGAGLAWVYPRYCKKRFCRSWKKLERNAKRLDRGIWHDTKPIPPWKWRRNKQ